MHRQSIIFVSLVTVIFVVTAGYVTGAATAGPVEQRRRDTREVL
jgi:hypothetical protein